MAKLVGSWTACAVLKFRHFAGVTDGMTWAGWELNFKWPSKELVGTSTPGSVNAALLAAVSSHFNRSCAGEVLFSRSHSGNCS